MLGPSTSTTTGSATAFEPARSGAPRRASKGGKANPNSPEQKKLFQACQDFESVMLGMVFKQMSASAGGDGLTGSSMASKTWKDLLEDERAKTMAASGGMGLADTLYRQLAEGVK